MARPVVLSNNNIFVGLNESGLVHDFYYPYVGLDNLTNARNSQHNIGVWADGNFSWVDEKNWDITLKYEAGTLIANVTMQSAALQIKIETQDFVDTEYNAFIRCLRITNLADKKRDIRVFMHQVFQISRAGRADTALYVPDDHYILDYKGRCCLLTAGKMGDGTDFDQFAVGSYNVEGKVGTFVDAEDGELSNNPVEHGGVDSVIRFKSDYEAGASNDVKYWVIAADSQTDAQVVHTHLKYYPIDERLTKTRTHWQNWLGNTAEQLKALPEAEQREVITSLLVVKAHCDKGGSILASGDSSIFNYGRDYYCYCWPRDAAYAIWPLIRLGLFEEAKQFFQFAEATIHRDGYMMHKYQPDEAIGSTWHPLVHNRHKELAIQEDETAMIVFMIGEYYRASQDLDYVKEVYPRLVAPCANFMSGFIDEATGLPHASYDLWEEKFLTTTYTVCTVIAALETAIELAKLIDQAADEAVWTKIVSRLRESLTVLYHPDGYFRKGFLLQNDGSIIYDDTTDISSLYGIYMFAKLPLSDPRLMGTLVHVEKKLLDTSPIGGVARYEHDNYFLAKNTYTGNPWIVCTLWLAQYYHTVGQQEKAQKLTQWAIDRAFPSGILSEQFDPDDGSPLSVAPLVWSHAEFVNTCLDMLIAQKTIEASVEAPESQPVAQPIS